MYQRQLRADVVSGKKNLSQSGKCRRHDNSILLCDGGIDGFHDPLVHVRKCFRIQTAFRRILT